MLVPFLSRSVLYLVICKVQRMFLLLMYLEFDV